MKIVRYPVAAFEGQFGWTAVVLEDPELLNVASSCEEACALLQQKLEEIHKESPWLEGPESENFQLHHITVELRPEYQAGKRFLPSPVRLEMRVPVLVGSEGEHVRHCVIPNLQLQFSMESGRSLREIVAHYVQEALKRTAPATLMLCAPPREVVLTEVKVRVRPQRGRQEGVKTPQLDIVAEAAHRSKLRGIGREALLQELTQALRAGLSVALVGPPGSGKSTLVVEAARRLRKTRAEEYRPGLWRSSAARIIAGMSYLGQWEQRCEQIVQELGQVSGILAIDSAIELVRQGGREPSANMAAFFAPYLLDAQLQMVCEATPEEWQACRRLLPGFADQFRTLRVEPMSEAETLEVLAWIRQSAAQSRSLDLSSEIDSQLVSLFQRFSPYQSLPGNAARFLKRLIERAGRGAQLLRGDAVAAFSRESGIPEQFLRDEIALDPEQLEEHLSARVIGQREAQLAALRIVTTFKAGLQDPQRPLGVLLLCGPTGVGKTELAKTLAEMLFSEEKRLIRLDMSEYSGPGSAERLLGTVYDQQPPTWLRQLRQRPFAVVLFDEVEKAHPEVFDVLLRAFDEGQLTDPWGRVTSLRTAVLLLTSNLGAERLRPMGLTPSQPPSYAQAVQQFFRPELLNRIDQIVAFGSLSADTIRSVARRELKLLERRPGLRRREMKLVASEQAVEELARSGYDARLGARPLQRCIEQLLIPLLTRVVNEHPQARARELLLDYQPRQGYTVTLKD